MRDAERQRVNQLLSDDPAAADAFVREWSPRVVAWVRRNTPAHRVEGYCQEVFLHLCQDKWSRLRNWDGLYSDEAWHPNSLAGYLRTITVNKVADLLRADARQLPGGGESRDAVADDGALGRNPEDATADARDKALFRECLDDLQPRDRNLLYLWCQGQQDSYTARLLGMNANNVRQRRHYVARKLSECVENRRRGD